MEEMFMKEPKDPKKVYTGILVVLVLLFVLGLVLVLTSAASSWARSVAASRRRISSFQPDRKSVV